MTVNCPFCGSKTDAGKDTASDVVCKSCFQLIARRAEPPVAKAPPPPVQEHAVTRQPTRPPVPPRPSESGAQARPAGAPPVPPVVANAPRTIRKTKAPALPPPPQSASRTRVDALPLLDALAHPPEGSARRAISLLCLALSLLVLVGSGGLAGWKKWKSSPPGGSPGPGPVALSGDPKLGTTPANSEGTEQLHGGIEIGAKGVKAVVVRLRETPGGIVVDLAAPPLTANTTLVAGLKETGILSTAAIEDTARAVGNIHEQLRKQHQIPPERIHVCGSSGLLAPIAGKSDLLATNKENLSKAIRKATGSDMGFVDAAKEMQLTHRGSVAPAHLDEALLLDVGSGSTKMSYSESGGARTVAADVPFGSVSLADDVARRVEEQGGKFEAQLTRVLGDSEKLEKLREAIKRDPALANQKRIYLVGGVVWALATIQKPWARGPYVSLTAADIDAFIRRLEESGKDTLPAPVLDAKLDATIKQEVEKEMGRVRKTFKREQLLAGARLLQLLHKDLGASADKELSFARNGYLGLAIGYVLSARTK